MDDFMNMDFTGLDGITGGDDEEEGEDDKAQVTYNQEFVDRCKS